MNKIWFVGIDISKMTLDIVIYDSQKKHTDSSNHLKVDNDRSGFQKMLKWLKDCGVTVSALAVGMENTGSYGNALRAFLEEEHVDYCCFTPVHLAHSFGLVRGKNDRVDAERIAYYTYLHRDELQYSHLSSKTILRLQELSTERKRLAIDRGKYRCIQTEAKRQERTQTVERAEEMLALIDKQIRQVEQEMEDVAGQEEAVCTNLILLLSITGIGIVNAVSTIVHTNNFKGFQNARQYACYLGIAPFERQSGTSIHGHPHVGLHGARQLKADLTQAAKSAINYDAETAAYYNRKTAEGKHFGVVLNAIKFKLVTRMFAVVKRGTPYVDLELYRAGQNQRKVS